MKNFLKNIVKSFGALFIPILVCFIVRFLALTSRFYFVNFEDYSEKLKERKQLIHACWHGRLLFCPYTYWGKNGISALVSHHRDGDMVARFFKHFGIGSVRGSTTRGSIGGVKGLLKVAKSGGDLALTPDGPKGPRHVAQMGVIHMAKRTGLPIYPISYSASKRKVFSSWDKFVMPYPFNKIVFICGDPISISRDSDTDEMEKKRLELENSLIDVTERADRYFD